MKKLLLPAMFVIALAGSAFSRISSSSHANTYAGYYQDNYWCDEYYFSDDNCTPDNTFAQYICEENVPGYGWEIMCQNVAGAYCFNPYYSYFPNE